MSVFEDVFGNLSLLLAELVLLGWRGEEEYDV